MASIYYTGKAIGVPQVSAVDIGANDSATTYSLTINGVSASTTGGASAEATATALVAAWNASVHPYHTPITAAVDADASPSVTITLTGDDTDGMPFTVTASVSGGTGTIGSVSNTTTATGPHHWSNADNWSLGRIPGNGDTIYITKPGARLCWDIDRSGDSPTELWTRLVLRGDVRIGLSFAGVATSADGDTVSNDAPEYRGNYLVAAITTVDGLPYQSATFDVGSGRVHIDNRATGSITVNVKSTDSAAADTTRPAWCLLMSSSSAVIYVDSARGGVGVAVGDPGETSTINKLIVSDTSSVSRAFLSDGVTVTGLSAQVRQNGGVVEIDGATTHPMIKVNGGTMTVDGSQAVTTMTVNGGLVIANTSGTITTLTQEQGSTVDFLQSDVSRAVTNYNFNGGTRKYDADVMSFNTENRSGRVTESIV